LKAQLAAEQSTHTAAQSNATSVSRNASGASENISAAKSQVDVLKAQEELARVDLARTEELVKRGTLAPSVLDEARSKELAVQSQIAEQHAVESMIKNQAGALWASGTEAKSKAVAAGDSVMAAKAAVAGAEVAVSECKLLAPRNAMVVSRNFEPGEAVQPGTNVLALTDLTEARTRFYLPNAELAAAAPGR
jgi:multidrug resistance efflux pump